VRAACRHEPDEPPQARISPDARRAEGSPVSDVDVDVAIVGAGPAGLAAAAVCAKAGLATTVFDEQPSPGGQIHRAITASPLARPEILGEEYWRGATLVVDFLRAGARYVPDATVWALAPSDGAVTLCVSTPGRPKCESAPERASAEDGLFSTPGRPKCEPAPERASAEASLVGTHHGAERLASSIRARAAIVATGALERPMPVPGWTLAGVLMAGGAQALLKSAGVVPRGRTVLAGSGPLLWLLAAQYLRAGVDIAALLDTTPRGRLAQALRHAPAFVTSGYFATGSDLVRYVRRRTRVVEYVESLAIEGGDAVAGVCFRRHDADERLAADQVLLHQGVVPDVSLVAAAGGDLAWDDLHACFVPVVDGWGGTTVPGVYVAGDGAGIAGADAAASRGRLAGLAVANALGATSAVERDRQAATALRALARAQRGRPFLDVLYRPADAFRRPAGDTLACRCEEVTARAIRGLARSGTAGPNQMKALTRCGMGPCQGRYCALTVTELIAEETGRAPGEVGMYRARFPVKPVSLGELAAMPATVEEMRAVDRG